MSEIEFRLERTPVEESDDEVQHDDVPTGKCIAPIFDKKLKNFRAMEGGPVTFSCKIVGIPIPKVSLIAVLIKVNCLLSALKFIIHICASHQVYWFKDGKQILKKNVHYKKIREGDGTCGLHIECTTSDDDGNYTIMAANPQVIFSSIFWSRCQHLAIRCKFWCLYLIFNDETGTNQLFWSLNCPNRPSSKSTDTYSLSEVSKTECPIWSWGMSQLSFCLWQW